MTEGPNLIFVCFIHSTDFNQHYTDWTIIESNLGCYSVAYLGLLLDTAKYWRRSFAESLFYWGGLTIVGCSAGFVGSFP